MSIIGEVTVVEVRVTQDRICIPRMGQDLHDCAAHDHLPGAKQVQVEVVPHVANDVQREAFVNLVGKRCRLVVVE